MRARIPAAVAVVLIALSPITAPAQSTPGAQIAALQLQAVADFLAASPEIATFLGDYRHDGEWSDPSPAGIARFKAMLSAYEQKINAIEMTSATLQDVNDIKLMRAFVVGQRRALADQEAGKDPSAPPLTVLGAIFTMILHKDEQDPSVWWDHVISRMEKAPAWMAAQRPQITHPGRLQAQVALKQLALAPGLFFFVLTPMSAQLPADQRARFTKARDALVASMNEWTKWMQTNAPSWPINYAMGADAYNAMLRDELLLPYDAGQIAAIGQKTLDAAIAAERQIKAAARAKGVNLSNPLQAAANGGGMTPTTKDAQFAFFQAQLDTLRAFIARKRIVTIPAYVGRMRIVETPAFLQPILPGPSMNPPPILSKQVDGVYFVPPPNPQMAKAAANGAIFEDFDRDRVLMTSGHEGFPGHFLQLSIAKHNADPVRRFSFDSVFAEGWAFYEEALLERDGLYGNDLDGRYAVAQFERLRGARAIVDTKLATGAWTFEQSVKWFAANAGVDSETALGEVSRFALGPGQAFDYAVGKTQIEALLAQYRSKKGAAFDLQAFHDDLLSHGTVPVSIIASEMLAE
ncbi:MAG: DUF885 domain-containing protein [Candidatus Eremiobacteraeota bacterium]|nr:DUF885 domain-containing protein [Candidatus Eremiobacteraeota bacterium]MBV8498315.1 DUF885 domain-containing protein [Candidatus Eremiobacteraeota bacterium]